MDFYNQMLLLSKDIFKKVKSIVEENKGNDEKYYSYSYLKLADGRTVKVSLLSYVIGSPLEIKIDNIQRIKGQYIDCLDSFHILENGKYGFSSNIFIKDNDGQMSLKEDKPIMCDFNDIKQSWQNKDSISEEEQKKVKLYIGRINDLVATAVYDTDLTHNVSNLVYEEKVKYNKQLFKKEMQKLEKSNLKSDILPSVKTAVDWWGNLIEFVYSRDKEMYLKHPDLFDEEDAIELDKNKLIKFKQILSKKLMDELKKGNDIYLTNDRNWPMNNIVCESFEESGLEKMGFWKHEMDISADFVCVRNCIPNLTPEQKKKLNNGTLFDDPEFRDYNPEESQSLGMSF